MAGKSIDRFAVEHIAGQTAGARASLDQIETSGLGISDWRLGLNNAPHLGKLLRGSAPNKGSHRRW
jgi:hypothetical protein